MEAGRGMGIRGGACPTSGGLPPGQAVGFVYQVVEAVFQLQCLGYQQASRLDRAGVLVPEASKPCRSQ